MHASKWKVIFLQFCCYVLHNHIIISFISALSTSVKAPQYLKADVPKSDSGKLFFDTHAVVRIFEENGLASFVA